MEKTTGGVSAARRVVIAFAIGLLVGVSLAPLTPWQVSTILAWDAAAAIFVVWVWAEIRSRDAAGTRARATREDSSRLAADLVLISASVVSLVGVAMVLLKSSESTGAARPATIAVAVVSVVTSWFAVHTVFTLRYAHLYYLHDGGLDFHDAREPSYADFAYVAFTIGMTFQVSDTDVTSRHIRASVFRHALLSYVFGIAVIALTINVVASLLRA
jgi:uncharacterized membrane protein